MDSVAVIFDMDGVLVDSYHAHYESWRLLAADSGLEYAERQFAATFGRTSREILAENWPVSLTDEQIAVADACKEELYRQIIRADFPEMPGAADLLRSLHAAGFALAIGSSGPRANIDVVVERLGAHGLFGAVVCGQDVHRGKPDPEVFQLAAAKLGAPPHRCVVVEDAPAGVEAANRARMTAIAITGTATRAQLAAAAWVVDTLAEITPQAIDALAADAMGGQAP